MPQLSPPTLAALVKAHGRDLGFDLVGIAAAEPSLFAAEYAAWLAHGFAGEMEYLKRGLERRFDPREIVPGARSVIVVGMTYYCDEVEGPGTPPAEAGRAIFARYARGDDYHEVMRPRLQQLLDLLIERAPPGASGRVYVDTGPLLERELAQKAGIGWFGKNTMLINTRRGSYFLLGEIITNVEMPPDVPAEGGCGTCTACLDACPTGALTEAFTLDARRCISYLTIELKGDIPDEFAPALSAAGDRVFGCDICQEVCPFNLRRSQPTTEPAFQPRDITRHARTSDLCLLTEEQFREQFKGSAVKRTKMRGLLRNAAAALSARDDSEAVHALEHAVDSPDRLVSDAAGRALGTIRRRRQSSTEGGDGAAGLPSMAKRA
ncbi:MAG: tRNA epoxyqueuosine(34) reductase QueG [Armatimonadetes bacterium]|nr:tRNA epoxyqueuosine(34) reductase QueG [Armatimonadota bacterium]MDE2207491.1 tRNA epoxyqueuosine(34) reductase QueG [Armatimonadota bacterium]